MKNNKIVYFGETLLDLTEDSVTPQTLKKGYTAHDATGEEIVGELETEYNWEPHDGMPDLDQLDISDMMNCALYTFDGNDPQKWIGLYVAMVSGQASANLVIDIGSIVDGEFIVESQITGYKGNVNIRLDFPDSNLRYPVLRVYCPTRDVASFRSLTSPTLEGCSGALQGLCNKVLDMRVKGSKINNLTSDRAAFYTLEHVKYENLSLVTSLKYAFQICYNLKQVDFVNCTIENVTTMDYIFQNCYSLRKVTGTSGWVGAKITTMRDAFNGCTRLEEVDFSSLEAPLNTNLYNAFNNCKSLTSLKIPKLNTSKVTTLYQFVADCSSLTSIDLTHFDTSSVTNFSRIFANMTNIEEIVVPNWDIQKGTTFAGLMSNCYRLKKCDLSTWTLPTLSQQQMMTTIIYNTYRMTDLKIPNNINYAISLSYFTLSQESLNYIVDHLGTANGAQTITIGTYNKYRLSDEQISIITEEKGWTLA